MANFGKKAKLDSQKSTVKVECLVSVYETTNDEDGNPLRYKVVVQRLQDTVDMKDAEAGLADALPFITNRKQWTYDDEGNGHAAYSHYDYVTAEMMDAIKKAARNCYESEVTIENIDKTVERRRIENYCVKLDIGFNLAKGEAFFYRIKQNITQESLAKDIKYNLRHMPAAGRELTAAILDGHRDVTDVAYRVYMDSLKLGKDGSRSPDMKDTEGGPCDG